MAYQRVNEDGKEILLYDNGAKKDAVTGHWIQAPPHAQFTDVTARLMTSRRRAIGLRAQLRGLIAGTGGEIPDQMADDITDADLLAAGSALQALTAHMARTFNSSSSLRGMAEVYDKLASPLIGDRRQRDADTDAPHEASIVVQIAQYIQHMHTADVIDMRTDNESDAE